MGDFLLSFSVSDVCHLLHVTSLDLNMSDIVVNFDLFGGLSVDEWSDKVDTEENRKKGHAEVNEEELLKLEKGRNESGTLKQTGWAVIMFFKLMRGERCTH